MLAEESERKLELKLGSKSGVGSAMPLGVEKDFVLVLGWVWVRGGLLGRGWAVQLVRMLGERKAKESGVGLEAMSAALWVQNIRHRSNRTCVPKGRLNRTACRTRLYRVP